MKKFLLKLLLCVLLICTSAICFIGCSEDGANGKDGISVEQESFSKGLVYQANSDRTGYVITGIGTNTDKVLKIPETYNGLPVTGFAFYDMPYADTYIQKLELPKNFMLHEEYDGKKVYNLEFLGYLEAVEEIVISEDNPYYKYVDGVVYSKDGKTLIFYAKNKQNASFTVPDGVETIEHVGYYSSNIYLEYLTLPSSLKETGGATFACFTSLKEVVIPNGLESIANDTFSLCTSLTSITIPDSVTSIGYQAFYYCTSLTSVTIGNGVTRIDSNAFQECTALSSITFNGTVDEWNAIAKVLDWNSDVPATKIICSDGEVTI